MKFLVAFSVGLLVASGCASCASAAQPIPPREVPETRSPSNHGNSEEIDPGMTFVEEGEDFCCDPCCSCSSCSLRHGLPCPRQSRCDMPQHLPYMAAPKFYYYFRPYNVLHIPEQQDDVNAFGGDRRHPYDNRVFQKVYQNLRFDDAAAEVITPTKGRQASVRRAAAEVRPSTSKSHVVGTSSRQPQESSVLRGGSARSKPQE